jgi:hypothetical protein
LDIAHEGKGDDNPPFPATIVARTKNQDSLHWRRKSREKGRGEVEGRS